MQLEVRPTLLDAVVIKLCMRYFISVINTCVQEGVLMFEI